jgi:hypothetical protein
VESNSRTGLAVAAAGGIITAISVYQPWYGLAFTQAAVSEVQQQTASVPGLSQYANAFGAEASSFVGRSVVGLSAHQALHRISIVLLVIAGIAILASLVGLAAAHPQPPMESGRLVAALGAVGALLVAYRMAMPPNPVPQYITLSLRPGVLMALVGCGAIVGGSLWSLRPEPAAAPRDAAALWSDLSGWTPS